MSITAYTGLPGSGKSYSVVEHQILPALKMGRNVCTNIPLVMEEVEKLTLPGTVTEFPMDSVAAEPARIYDYAKPGVVLILDEVWKLFPQGVNANKVPDEFKKLLAEHRHMVDESGNSMQIILVVQDLANIGAFARRLVESTFITTKLSHVGSSKSYRVDVFHGGVTGCTPSLSNRLRYIVGRYDRKIFALYKSHTMSDAAQAGANESNMDARANIWKRPAVYAFAILGPPLLWYCLHTFSSNFHGIAMKSSVADSAGASSAGASARSGAEHGRSASVPSAEPAPVVVSPVRLLLAVEGEAGTEGQQRALMFDGERIVELRGVGECRQHGRRVECQFRGAWYDEVGQVEVIAAPVAAYSSTLGVQGAGVGPLGSSVTAVTLSR